MKYRTIILLFSFFITASVFAQENVSASDSIKVNYYYEFINQITPNLISTKEINDALNLFVESNKTRKENYYSLRIFFDNSQRARDDSEQVVTAFKERYPQIPIYRKYENPYFKVTVGHFASKSDALKLMEELKSIYPFVFLVKDSSSTN
jgi:hypothetical protein